MAGLGACTLYLRNCNMNAHHVIAYIIHPMPKFEVILGGAYDDIYFSYKQKSNKSSSKMRRSPCLANYFSCRVKSHIDINVS